MELCGRVTPEDIEFIRQTTGCEVVFKDGQWVIVETTRKDVE